MIIGLVGKKFSGKDTLADYLVKKYGFIKYAFAKPLKEACKILFITSDDQLNRPDLKEVVDKRWNMTPREMMQYVGTDVIRNNIDPNFWIKHFEYWFEENKNNNIIVTDIRFLNELMAIKKVGGITIKICRDTISITDSHISEIETDTLTDVDHVIFNNSTKVDLYNTIETLYSRF